MIIYTKHLNIGGLALFPFIFINSKLGPERQKALINHERIHIRQQIEMLVIPFYLCYGINYLFNYLKLKNHQQSYRQIIFEREAFSKESDFGYLNARKFWGFLLY
jgi:hypothetical protein